MSYNIERYKGYTRITGVSKDNLDLHKTFNCGQCFRWKQTEKDVYFGVISELVVLVRQVQFEDGKYGLITTATKDQVENTLADYFQLDLDYEKQLVELDEFAKKSMEYGKGIRILKQEPWETLVSFIISQRNNIPKIASTIEKLCMAHGEKRTLEVEGVTFTGHMFPTAEKIASVGLEGLGGLGLGYRDGYISKAAQKISSGEFQLTNLRSKDISSEQAVLKMQEIAGVGPKVASCVALFGLGKLDSFPIDVWMQRVIDSNYPTGIDIASYGELAGLIQQYMFYYIRKR